MPFSLFRFYGIAHAVYRYHLPTISICLCDLVMRHSIRSLYSMHETYRSLSICALLERGAPSDRISAAAAPVFLHARASVFLPARQRTRKRWLICYSGHIYSK
jgi:hypothetical protein